MKSSRIEYDFKCDACGYESNDPHQQHQTIKTKAWMNMEAGWPPDHYKYNDKELSFCEPCGNQVWTAVLQEIIKIRKEG